MTPSQHSRSRVAFLKPANKELIPDRAQKYNPLLPSVVVFLAVSVTGITFTTWYNLEALRKIISTESLRAVNALNQTFEHAAEAGKLSLMFLDKKCDSEVLTGIRKITASVPDIRSISLMNGDRIYCSSVYGDKAFNLKKSRYPGGSITLMEGNTVTPDRPLAVYSVENGKYGASLIGVDGFYIYEKLRLKEDGIQLSVKMGDAQMDATGRVSHQPMTDQIMEMNSSSFPFSVLARQPEMSEIFSLFSLKMMALVHLSALVMALMTMHILTTRKSLRFRLKKAIARQELRAFIQPIVDIQSGKNVGGEVLIRWEDTCGRIIPADQFIGVAEKYNLTKAITSVCFTQVIDQLSVQDDHSVKGMFICFNAGAADFLSHELVDHCRNFYSLLGSYDIHLVIEVTEREAFPDNSETRNNIEKMKRMGVRFSLDDFGTGHANYRLIDILNPDFIKIDKHFTAAIEERNEIYLMVKNMVNLGMKMNCRIIAEGIESDEQIEVLSELGVRFAQGYRFSRAVPVNDFFRH